MPSRPKCCALTVSANVSASVCARLKTAVVNLPQAKPPAVGLPGLHRKTPTLFRTKKRQKSPAARLSRLRRKRPTLHRMKRHRKPPTTNRKRQIRLHDHRGPPYAYPPPTMIVVVPLVGTL